MDTRLFFPGERIVFFFPGERIVFEKYSREFFMNSQKWILEREIFENSTLGSRDYTKATVSAL